MRLIDADDLKEHLFVGADYDKAINDGIDKTEEEVFAFKCGWNDALKSVAQFAPTVDAVEVVRCKDCVGCDRDDGSPWCGLVGLHVDDDHYCAWGERKDDTVRTV